MTGTRAPLGRLTAGDPPVLEFERTLHHPIDKVWHAVTSRDHLHAWFPCDVIGERRAGAEVQAPFWPEVTAKMGFDDPGLTGRITVWEPPRVFEWLWSTDTIRFELTPRGDDTVLRLTVHVVDLTAGVVATAGGYHVCLDHLAQVLDTGDAPCVIDADHETLELAYSEAFGLPAKDHDA
ncbi:MAG: SRPBCC family protein [Acidimicrobiia bacterium]